MNISEMWFHQDGAELHTARETIEKVRTQFETRTISEGDDVIIFTVY